MPVQTRAFPYTLPNDPHKIVVRDSATFEGLVRRLKNAPVLIMDSETSGLAWFRHARAIGWALGTFDDHGQVLAWYVPLRHQTGERQLDIAQVGPAIADLFANPESLKIAHNWKFDCHIARAEGWKVAGPRYCTLIGARLYDENSDASLKKRAVTDLHEPDAATWESHIAFHVQRAARIYGGGIKAYKERFGYAHVPVDICGHYACYDIDYTGRLYRLYELIHKLREQMPRIVQTEMDLTEVLCDMEEAGLPIDTAYLEGLRETLLGRQSDLETQVWAAFPDAPRFSLSNDNELRRFLLRDLHLPLTKPTKGGETLSVDRDVLDSFSERVPGLALISHWRDAQKIATTYTDSILSKLDARDVVHCDMKQMGTETGRLSSASPNLQNIASDSNQRAKEATGKSLDQGGIDPWSVRRAFIMRDKGWVRLFFDYSQIELRVLTWYCQDPILLDSYIRHQDVHTRTSLEVFGTDNPAMRRVSKIVNFGLVYGMQAKGLASQAGISIAQAEEFLARYFARYGGVPAFRDAFLETVRAQDGTFANAFGRLRHVPLINSRDKWEHLRYARKAFSALIQGQAAELTKEALVRVARRLRAARIPHAICLTVHDEIQIDTPAEYLAQVVKISRQVMENFPEFAPVPICVEAKYATHSWADAYDDSRKIHTPRRSAAR